MRGHHFCACGLICGFVMSATALGQPLYRLTDLGTLPTNFNYSSAYSINNSGAVTGESTTMGLHPHAFHWSSSGGMIDLGDFAGGEDSSNGAGINSLGHVAGHGHVEKENAVDSGLRAFLWTPSGGLQNLGVPAGAQGSWALGINSTDHVVGHSFSSDGVMHRAFLWSGTGGFTDLGDLSGGSNYTVANSINDANTVVGFSRGAAGPDRAFFWTEATGMVKMQDLSSTSPNSLASDINALGSSVGASFNGTVDRAVMWNPNGVITELGALPGGMQESGASAINRARQVVGNSNVGIGDFDDYRAFLWTSEAGIRDLNDLLDESGEGWRLQFAHDINDSGQIVGQGIYCTTNSCVQHAYLLTPIPEPAIAVLCAIGLVALRRRRVC